MSLSVRMIVVLTVVGLISGSLLSVVGLMTTDLIELNRQREIEAADSVDFDTFLEGYLALP